jgi:hypothetical protein
MASREKWWAVAYGNVVRWEKAATAHQAAMRAFGLVDAERMTVRQFPGGGRPSTMPIYRRNLFIRDLAARHEEKTGIVIK